MRAYDIASESHARAVVAAGLATTALEVARRTLTGLGSGVTEVARRSRVHIDVSTEGSDVVVTARGELDMDTSPHLEQVAVDRLDTHREKRLVVDLAHVTFMDSSGLAVLVELRRVAGENGQHFALTGVGKRSRRLLELTKLDLVFTILG